MRTTAVRLRSGSSVVTPPAPLTLMAHFVADDIAQADASAVATWVDRAITPHDLTQAASARRPTYRTNILLFNNHAVVRFVASTIQWMQAAAGLSVPQPHTTFVVARANLINAIRYMTDGASLNQVNVGPTTTKFFTSSGTANIADGTVQSIAGVVLAAVNQGASSRMRTSGGAGTGGNAGANGYTGLTVGIGGNVTNGAFDGDIAEIRIYSGAATVAELNTIGGDLATTYGLVWTTAT